jgi:tellurite resistance protein TerC
MSELLAFGALLVALVVFLLIDLRFFARGRMPSFREGLTWSIGWLVISLLAGLIVLAAADSESAIEYTTVYLIERSLSLDNLFVFILLFSYFGVPEAWRARLLFWGIIAALVLRGLAILGGVALIERFEFVIYVLGVLLLLLAYRILRGVGENVEPDKNLIVRVVRRFFPVTNEFHETHWFWRENGKRYVTPTFLCLCAIVAADIAFAVDSIPAAFAITRDSFVIWMANVFALLGLRALFVLVEGLIRRFRYLDETIAFVLAIVGVRLLIEDFVHIGPVVSLLIVIAAFAVGMIASVIADRRDPEGREAREREFEEKLREEQAHAAQNAAGADGDGDRDGGGDDGQSSASGSSPGSSSSGSSRSSSATSPPA